MDENAKMGPSEVPYEYGLIAAINRCEAKPELTVADAAVIYAQCGVPAFPCHAKTKSPLVKNGFKAATADVDQVREWWTKWPDAMIGVPTGSASGFWVLDVDDLEIFNAGCKINLPKTLTTITGNGKHYLFRWDTERTVRNAQKRMEDGKARWPFSDAPGCDTRGEGGYIIVPPSRHPSGRLYRWKDISPPAPATEALYACVAGPKRASVKPLRAKMTKAAAIGLDAVDPEEILNSACQEVRNAPQGAQEGTLNSACFAIGALIADGSIPYAGALNRLVEAANEMPSFDADHPWRPEDLGRKVTRTIKAGMQKARKKPKRADKPSEDFCASKFVREHGAVYRYDSDDGRWLKWSGQHWAFDRKHQVAHDTRLLVRNESGGDPICCRSSFINGVLKLVTCDPNIAIAKADLDKDGFLLGTPEGTVDLRTGKLGQANPEHLITKTTTTGPKTGRPDKWLMFVAEITGGDTDLQRYLQMVIGYCLTGSTKEQSLFFLYGVGANGKSVFLNVIAHILGDYATTAATQSFMASRFPRHTTDLAALSGARLVTASETEEHNAWDEGLIKQVTGGEQITARFMRQNNFSFLPTFKLVVAGNYPPIFNNVDPATRRRLKIIPFNFKPARIDKDLINTLLMESGQILSWAIEGCLMWQRDGLSLPALVDEATDEFFSTQDPFQDWLDQKCKSAGYNTATGSGELWQSWQDFAKKVGEDPKTQKSMALKLKAKGFRVDRTSRKRVYLGIAMRKDNDEGGDQAIE